MTIDGIQKQLNVVLKKNDYRKIYIQQHGENERGESCRFSTIIQDVARFSVLQSLELTCIDIGRFDIEFIEVAFDTFGNDPAEQTALFYTHLSNPVSDNCRLYRNGKGTPKRIPNDINELKRHLLDGWQIGIGDCVEKDPNTKYQHIYVKDSDTINGQRQPVERRARIEITLAGDSLPTRELAEWRQFQFEQLAPYFMRQQERPDATDADWQKEIERRMQIDDDPKRRRSYTHQADPINRRVYSELRELSRRWQTTGRRGRPANTKQDRVGKLLRGNCRVSNCFVDESACGANNYIKGGTTFPLEPRDKQQRQAAKERSGDTSAESATLILHDDRSHSAADEMNHLFNESPEAKKESERTDAIMREWIGEADPPARTSKS